MLSRVDTSFRFKFASIDELASDLIGDLLSSKPEHSHSLLEDLQNDTGSSSSSATMSSAPVLQAKKGGILRSLPSDCSYDHKSFYHQQ
ncbi:hypothetical protein E4U54_002017 [Claviceps lovelessii]|nr:hypothetical protein E4U54_002017 [Claviceps lovelessii]